MPIVVVTAMLYVPNDPKFEMVNVNPPSVEEVELNTGAVPNGRSVTFAVAVEISALEPFTFVADTSNLMYMSTSSEVSV